MAKALAVSPVLAGGSGKVTLLRNPYQEAFLAALDLRLADGRRAFNRLGLFSGRRGGKTLIGAIGTTREARRPHQRIWACAPSYPKLYDYVIPALAATLPAAWLAEPYSKQHYQWTLINGTTIQTRSLDDVNRGRGPGLDLLWIDEGRDVAPVAYHTLVPALVDRRGAAILTTSPNGFDWCTVSGSLIRTYSGDVPIESLTVGTRVWTRQGWKPVTHVTYMGEKPTVIVEAGGQTLRCTADHRIATPDGWVTAGALTPRAAGTDPAVPPAVGADVGIFGIVGMLVGAAGPRELDGDVRVPSRVLAMRDGFEMRGVDTAFGPAEMIDLQPGRDRGAPVGDPVGEPARPLLPPHPANPARADERVARVLAGTETGPGPDPTATSVRPAHSSHVFEGEFVAVEVSRVSHGVILPVWDIGVKDCHEFVADGLLVHNCYETFYAPALAQEPGYWACKYRTSDNPSIDATELASARREMDALFYQQEFEAEFVSFTGSIYGDCLAPQLLESDEAVKALLPEWPLVNPDRSVLVGLDPGADHPFGAVVLVSTANGLIVVDEYLAREAATVTHVSRLLALFARRKIAAITTYAMDRSAKQMAIELAQHGINVIGAENDVMAGIQRLKSWLIARRLWIVRASCPKLASQMYSYRWAENTTPSGERKTERVLKVNDDLPDALRYIVISWPELPEAPSPSLLRNLDAVPTEHRWALEREQRCSHPEAFEQEDDPLDRAGMLKDDSESAVGDFWG